MHDDRRPEPINPEPNRYDDAITDNDDGAVSDAWTIQDFDTANWASRVILQAQAHIDGYEAWAENEIMRILRTRDHATAPHKRSIDRMTWELRRYLIAARERGEVTRKSLKLTGGTIKLNPRPAKLTIKDEDAFMAWAEKHHADLLNTKTTIDKKMLNKVAQLGEDGIVALDGEPNDLLAWEPQDDNASFVVAP